MADIQLRGAPQARCWEVGVDISALSEDLFPGPSALAMETRNSRGNFRSALEGDSAKKINCLQRQQY